MMCRGRIYLVHLLILSPIMTLATINIYQNELISICDNLDLSK